ncbi:MAG: prepilin-type N-terminal cleavage/methylation domain-containing protein [Rhodospirillales bacterium]|nr:prepilin-type N-terminal cleavage/methylation domain-containing protein [Rhodospirillales bacterium]
MRTRGFTLIEVLVATAIAALLMVSLMRSFSLGLRMVGRAGDSLDAVLVAESTLAMVGRAIPLAPGERADRVGPYVRRLRISRIVTPAETPGAPGISPGVSPGVSVGVSPGYGLTAYQVSVAVAWRHGLHERAVRLDTVRLAGGAAP